MNFVTLNFKLHNGGVAKTQIQEQKADAILNVLNQYTKAWLDK